MKLLTNARSLGVTIFLLFSVLSFAQTTVVERSTNDTILDVADKMPEYPGGINAMFSFIHKNMHYPAIAQENGIQGTVYIRFVVTKTGTVDKVEVVRSLDPACDKEAVRVVSLLERWIPGQKNGKNVNVYFTLPIKFKLTKDNPSSTPKPMPLFVVDGKEATKAEVDMIDKSRIKEVTVIKETSDLMKYGEKGKNGVILITLKPSASIMRPDSTNGKKVIYDVVEKMPEFPGGDIALFRFIRFNLRYPAEAQKARIEGTVYARFQVNQDGKVEKAEILRSLCRECDRETIRVIYSMPDWKPGMQKGKNVSVWYTLPVKFRLE